MQNGPTYAAEEADENCGIEITPEMIEAGLRILWDSGAVEHPMDADRLLIQEIFSQCQGLDLRCEDGESPPSVTPH